MLPALGSLATQQANPTQNTKKLIHQLLDYAATHPDAIITYRASDMVLAGHSDASYLSETKARSRAGGHFFMSNNDTIPSNNGAILTISQIIKAVMSSAAEAEIGALYINCKEAIPARHALEFLGHKQPPTPMQTDNTTALGVVNNNVMKKLKSMDMKYHWLRCQILQRQFRHYWAAGNAAATREQFVAQHKIEQKSYRDYLSVEEAGKELILYAVGDDAVAPLKINLPDGSIVQSTHICDPEIPGLPHVLEGHIVPDLTVHHLWE